MFLFCQILFNENSNSVDSFKIIPPEKIFFETDEFEGSVEKIYLQAAKIKNISVEELKQAVWGNFDRIEKTITNRN